MSNDFFNDHPMLGSFFDFDHDGSVSFGEGMAMPGVFGAFADEVMRDSENGDRDDADDSWGYYSSADSKNSRSHNSYADFDDDDDYDADFDDFNGVSEVNASDAYAVMEAVRSPLYDWGDIEWLAKKALERGTKSDEDEIGEICDRIYDHDLNTRLRCSV